MKLVSVSQMRELDTKTIQKAGIPGEILMERAGTGAAEIIMEYISGIAAKHAKRFVILSGKGNNGGDALTAAKYLYEHSGKKIKIFSVCLFDDLSGEAKFHAGKLPREINCEIRGELSPNDFSEGDIIIDGLLGTGTTGAPRPPYNQWISVVNSLDLPVISLDIPSGLDGDSGQIANIALQADLTITIGLPKTGLLNGRGPDLCGQLRCVGIGIPSDFISTVPNVLEMTFASDIRKFLSRVPSSAHKKSRGAVLVIGGSFKYGGAPILTGKAALRSGTGLVTVAIPENSEPFASETHSLIIRKIPDGGAGVFSKVSIPLLQELIGNSDAIVAGPGMTDDKPGINVLKMIIETGKPVVLDADALNLMASFPALEFLHPNTILTPHPGEMHRLLKGAGLDRFIKKERVAQASALAEKTGAIIVLKGRFSVTVQNGKIPVVNSSGSPALATAGTGDVLSGMIGAFLSQGISSFDAATAAVFIHGLAGELSPYGIRGLIADDLVDLIPEAMKRISPFA